MERRPLQTELPLGSRTRRALTTDTAAVTLRVPPCVAFAVTADPSGAVAALETGTKNYLEHMEANPLSRVPGEPLMDTVARREAARPVVNAEAFVGYTGWRTGKPPCSGYWDLNNGISTQIIRRWYDAEKDEWRTSNRVDDIRKFPFTADLLYRGLQAPAIGGYPYRVPGQRVRLMEASCHESQRVQPGTHGRGEHGREGVKHRPHLFRGPVDAALQPDAAPPAAGRRSQRGDLLAAEVTGAARVAGPELRADGCRGALRQARNRIGLTMSSLGITLTVLATGLAEAYAKDEAEAKDPSVEDRGFDISAGMFGPHVSGWLREVATATQGGSPPAAAVEILRSDNERMRDLLDRRPAVNAGLASAYTVWNGLVYTSDRAFAQSHIPPAPTSRGQHFHRPAVAHTISYWQRGFDGLDGPVMADYQDSFAYRRAVDGWINGRAAAKRQKP